MQGAWIRPAVKGQSGTGGFMRLTSTRDLTLLGFSVSARVGKAELHEMSMDGDVMRMREIESLPLAAGKATELRPGGHHLMITGLQRGLKAGEKVEVELRLKDVAGKTFTQAVAVPVQARARRRAPQRRPDLPTSITTITDLPAVGAGKCPSPDSRGTARNSAGSRSHRRHSGSAAGAWRPR